MRYHFENYVLDTRRYELVADDVPLSLRPLAFHVLAYLVKHRDRVVSQDELFEHIWPDEHAGDLSSCVKAIRQVLNDSGRSQRIIRTVRGHGYRFIAALTSVEDESQALQDEVQAEQRSVDVSDVLATELPVSLTSSTSSMVGRTAELHQLSNVLSQTLAGKRQLMFITGEAGIGKTTLVDSFIASLLSDSKDIWVGYGQCIEQYSAGEPYLPLLETLSRLGRSQKAKPFFDIIRKYAPS